MDDKADGTFGGFIEKMVKIHQKNADSHDFRSVFADFLSHKKLPFNLDFSHIMNYNNKQHFCLNKYLKKCLHIWQTLFP